MLVIHDLFVYTITLWDLVLSPFLKSLDKVGNLVKDTVVQGRGRIRIQNCLKLTFIPLLCSDINNIVGELKFVWCYGLPEIGL